MSSKERSRLWYAANKERHAATAKARYERNRAQILAKQRIARAANPEKYRAVSRANSKQYRCGPHRERWLESHRRRYWKSTGRPEPTRPRPTTCENCGRKDSKALCLDHDPITGRFRGWLCGRCNRAIGLLGDSIEGLLFALAYLARAA